MWPNFTTSMPLWSWLAILAVPPAIVILYFLKLKRRPIEVPSTFLWRKSIEDLHVNSLWQRLRQNLLLLLQLLLMLLVILALLGPSWQGRELADDRFIFLVDNSASMQAKDANPTRLERAKKLVAEYIDAMPSGAVAMIVSFADGAHVEQTFTDNRAELKRRLALIKPSAHTTSLVEALQVASGLANPGRSAFGEGDVSAAAALEATMYIFSDGKAVQPADFALGNLKAEFVPIGKPEVANLGIVAFNVGRNEERNNELQAFARVQNFGTAEVKTIISLMLDGAQIDAVEATILASSTQGVVFPLPGFGGGVLEVRIQATDDFPLDNTAWMPVEPPRPGRVLLVTPGNKPLMRALTTEHAKRVATVIEIGPAHLGTEDYRLEAASGAYDLIIFDQCTPKTMPEANTLFIGSLPPEGWKSEGTIVNPVVIDVDRLHPLTQYIDFSNVLIVESRGKLESPTGGRVLLDTTKGPILSIAPRGGFVDAVLGFNLVNSQEWETTWPVRPSFSVFGMNVLQYLGGGSESLSSMGATPGQTVALRHPGVLKSVVVKTPGGESITVPRSNRNTYEFSATDELGVYQILWDEKDQQELAVNLFSPEESDIAPATKLNLGATEVQEGERTEQVAPQPGWKPLLLAALAVLLFEWYIFNRRVYL